MRAVTLFRCKAFMNKKWLIKKIVITFMRLKMLLATWAELQLSKAGRQAKYFINNFFLIQGDQSQILQGKVNSRFKHLFLHLIFLISVKLMDKLGSSCFLSQFILCTIPELLPVPQTGRCCFSTEQDTLMRLSERDYSLDLFSKMRKLKESLLNIWKNVYP